MRSVNSVDEQKPRNAERTEEANAPFRKFLEGGAWGVDTEPPLYLSTPLTYV